jgi:hypothetical protein
MANSIHARVMIALLFLLSPWTAIAENITFVKEYTYRASDIDSKVSSRAIALQEVKRSLLEKLGMYLISETEVKNYKMTKDQITTLTAGIVSTEILQEKWDGSSYYLQAKLTVDPKEVANAVKALGNDVEKTRELEASRRKIDEAMKELQRLKQELELSQIDRQRQISSQIEYTRAIQDLSVGDWFSGYLFTLKDGGSFIWTNYKTEGGNYCTTESFGTMCIEMGEVASIKKGEYAPNVEVISHPADPEGQRRAEKDWKQRQANNEQEMTAIKCRQMLDELKQQRDQEKYAAQLRQYRSICSGSEQRGQAGEDRSGKSPERPSSPTRQYRDNKTSDMDRIIKEENAATIFK